MSDLFIILSIVTRIFSAAGAYFFVIRRLLEERALVPPELKTYNLRLIISVLTFIASCLGTALFQACRVGIVPHCSSTTALDIVTVFNSISLLSAFIVMYLITNTKQEIPTSAVKDIKESLKIIGKQTKKAETRAEQIDENTEGEVGNVMRGKSKKGKGKK